MSKANEKIRRYASEKKVFLWEVAMKFGIADSQFSRRMRVEFTPEEAEKAMRFIDEIAAERS